VISNPLSGGNRRGLAAIHRILRDRPEIPHCEARSAQDVREVLADFARRGVELVAVNSGDGTIQAVMTALFSRRPFPEPPLLALLNGGTTNMTHQDLGLSGPAAGALERLVAWAHHGNGSAVVRQRTVMRVDNPLHPEPLYGFFLGAACIHKGIRFFHAHVRKLGLSGDPAHLLIMARFLAALARRDDRLVAPVAADIRADLQPLGAQDYLAILVTTLDRLILGLRPFWQCGTAPLRLTAIGARPARLHRALPALVMGRACPQASRKNGYFSGAAHRISLSLDGGFALDGELYTALRRHPIGVSGGGAASFLRL
jgi:hypothetical protein